MRLLRGTLMPNPSLTIGSIRARPVVLKLKRAIVARIATIAKWPLILIDLATDGGVTGRAYLEPYVVKSMCYLVAALLDLGTALNGSRMALFELFDNCSKIITLRWHGVDQYPFFRKLAARMRSTCSPYEGRFIARVPQGTVKTGSLALQTP